jgi:hypothetical protein
MRCCLSFEPAAQLPDDSIRDAVDPSRSVEPKLSSDLPRRPSPLESELEKIALARLELPDHRRETLRRGAGFTLHQVVLGTESSGVTVKLFTHVV